MKATSRPPSDWTIPISTPSLSCSLRRFASAFPNCSRTGLALAGFALTKLASSILSRSPRSASALSSLAVTSFNPDFCAGENPSTNFLVSSRAFSSACRNAVAWLENAAASPCFPNPSEAHQVPDPPLPCFSPPIGTPQPAGWSPAKPSPGESSLTRLSHQHPLKCSAPHARPHFQTAQTQDDHKTSPAPMTSTFTREREISLRNNIGLVKSISPPRDPYPIRQTAPHPQIPDGKLFHHRLTTQVFSS